MTRRKKQQSTPPISPKSDDSFEEAFLREDRHKNGKPRPSANARERERMRVLSRAFSRLKTTLPWVPADTKLSKLDTLRLACSYIAHLKQILEEDEPPVETSTTDSGTIHPVALTWPYTFNGKVTAAAPEQQKKTSPTTSTTSSTTKTATTASKNSTTESTVCSRRS